jgi:hypothetical protein
MSKAIERSPPAWPGHHHGDLENTYIPERKGAILTITKQGKRVFAGTVTDTRGGVAHRGEFGLELRTGLHMIGANTYRQPIDREGHSVTWRILVT